MSTKLSKKEIICELWNRGQLSYKLDATQKELYQLFYNSNHKVQTWLLARRNGKSYALCVLALEQCLRHPNSIVKYVAPTKNQVNTIVRPLFNKILADCPEELKPEFHKNEYVYYFRNGSEIQLAGTDGGHAEKLRGGDSHIAIVDEAGSCTDLNNIVKSVLLPTTLTTKGKIILASTPAKEPTHDFDVFVEEAEIRGSIIKKTIYDNKRLTIEQIEEFIKEMGGVESEQFKREGLCLKVQDTSTAVIPEFTPELEKEIIREWPKPPFYDAYAGMDIGFKDLTVVIFGYVDFRADKLIIEDEIVLQGKDLQLPRFAKQIQDKEKELWYNHLTNEVKKPYKRVSDINYIVQSELARITHGEVVFETTKKDDNAAAINQLRVLLDNKKVIIHPRCKTLIRHLKNVKWKSHNDKTTFARSPDDGHYDAVEALKYLVRSVHFNKNPYPASYGLNTKDLFIANPDNFYANKKEQVFRKMLGLRSRN